MRNPRTRVVYFQILLASALVCGLGCGDSLNNATPNSAVSSTQHPLVAEYTITVPHSGASSWVEFGTDQSYGRKTSPTASTTGSWQTVTLLVAGMRPSTTYHMRAHVDWYGGSWVDQDKTFTTAALPSGMVTPQITINESSPDHKPAAGVELLDLTPPSSGAHELQAFVTDLQGNVLWYYDVGQGNFPFPIRQLPNGDFLVTITGIVTATETGTAVIREVDLAGNVVREVSVDQINQSLGSRGYSLTIAPFHHDVISLPNGHWVVLAAVFKSFNNLPGYLGTTNVQGDAIIDIDSGGNVAWVWNTFDHLDVNRHPLGLPDWTHSNALVYTPDGNLLVSMRNQSWVLKIDYENGQGPGDILWRLGDGGDFQLAGGNPSDWFYGQHFPNPISVVGSQTQLAVFDDGNNRVMDDIGDICGTPGFLACYSRGTIYQVNEDTKAANLQWQYSPGLFTFW